MKLRMKHQELQIKCKDGFEISGNLFAADPPAKGSVVICPALGVPQKFYSPFAMFVSDNGYDAITFDYRGIGRSKKDSVPGREIHMSDWGALDIDAVLDDIVGRKTIPLIAVGHSAGGQLIGLAPLSKKLAGIMLTPASSASWRLYPPPFKFVLYMLWHILIPLLSVGRNYFPAKMLGLGSVDVPTGVMSQWAQWARKKDYLFSTQFDNDISRYSHLGIPILAYGFSDDAYASTESIEHLLSLFSAAKIDRRFMNTKDIEAGSIGHFGFFKEKMKTTFWSQALDWMDKTIENLNIIKKTG